MSVTTASSNSPLISPRVAVVLVLISALTALAFLALNAYAPDLRNEKSASATVVSKSAIGFAGLRVLLEDMHVRVDLGRDLTPKSAYSMVILTPEPSTDAKELDDVGKAALRLIVLPKWSVSEDQTHSGWVQKLNALPPAETAAMLQTMAKGAKLVQGTPGTTMRLHSEPDLIRPLHARSVTIDRPQTISGPNLMPVVVDEDGRAVLVFVKGTSTYILSDPDFLNNQGLANIDTARTGYALIDGLRSSSDPVSFDVTLNGFGRSPDLLRTVFSPPFLGATLCVLLAAAFLGFHAMSRFGSPRAPDCVFAFGKRALADNTAAVIRMMHREPAMAPRYAQAVLGQMLSFFGIGRGADLSAIGVLEQRSPVPYRFADLSAEARDAHDAQSLMQVAKKLFRWRRTITHEHL